MQREVELLRRTVQECQKASRKQAKRIEELSTQAVSHHKVIHDKEQELATLREKCSKLEKHISSVEGAIQCQICMDLPDRPYTLSPCGHVLCLSCLQEWFKTSLGQVDDEDEGGETGSVLNRDKTCPCCRTVVKHRPCPAFMVKEVVSTFAKATSGVHMPQGEASENAEDDPWEGIFPDSDAGEECDLDDFSDDDDDFGIDLSWMAADRGSVPGFATWTYGTDSEDGAYSDEDDNDEDGARSEGSISEGNYGELITYVEPRWEPPAMHVNPSSYHLEANDDALSLLRRGCTWDMVQNFDIRYSHRQGIIVSLRSIEALYNSDGDGNSSDEEAGGECLHHIYLGWNVRLEEDDPDGEVYMQSVLADIKNRPERWRLVPRYDGRGSMDVKRLVPAESLEEYYTTDTDSHLEQEGEDMDFD
ncbi:hypothetical protein NMY22_g17985 [Coprinellus aureogranulatus]|nr:hypothetical protein NMY22_g17985 [Coprinellus aureogranulatus]